MNVLLVGNSELKKFLENVGYNVYTTSFENSSDFRIETYNFKLEDICKEYKIDVLLQVETLGKREIIFDLCRINCLKIYFSIDVHLNYYWQKKYSENFHIFISSQKNFFNIHKKTGQVSYWLPWGINPSVIKDFVPFHKREHDIAFVGLIDNNRIKRKNIVDLIRERYNVFIAGDKITDRISFEKMLSVYRNSKIVINESINYEVNFRYFEATSTGAILFTEKIDNGENELFIEDKEFITFSQESLFDKLDRIISSVNEFEHIGYEGYKRTFDEHTLQNRAEKIKKIIEENLDKICYCKKSVVLPAFFTLLRGIGDNYYTNFILEEVEKSSENNNYNNLIIFNFKKIKNKFEALDFLFLKYNLNNDELYLANIIITLIENNEEEKAIKLLNGNDIVKGLLKLTEKLIKKKRDYLVGFVNNSKVKVILTGFDILVFLFEKYNSECMRNKKANYLAAKILINNRNYQGAVSYLLNNVRNFPDDVLTRKMLLQCYYELYSFELYHLERLKILLLEKEFLKFKNDKEASFIHKKEAIMDLVTHLQNKKLIRDFYFYLEEFLQEQ